MKEQYFKFEILENIYLEDSFVLDIIETGDSISFKMDFVLCEKHPLYKHPLFNEQYCYQEGSLVFSGIIEKDWKERNMHKPNYDKNSEIDYGNIDSLYLENEYYYLEGDWGILSLKCLNISLSYCTFV